MCLGKKVKLSFTAFGSHAALEPMPPDGFQPEERPAERHSCWGLPLLRDNPFPRGQAASRNALPSP